MFRFLPIYLFFVLEVISIIGTPNKLYAQQKTIKGTLTDEQSKPLAFANIQILEIGLDTRSDEKGSYSIQLNGAIPSSYTIRFSFLGKKTIEREYNFNNMSTIPPVTLYNNSLALEEVSVQATKGSQSNSSLLIDRDMIERYPSLSLNDLLNLLPNRKVSAPSVQEMQNITLRGAFEETSGRFRNVHGMSNAFGVAIIMDDIAMSNNANMQSRNPGIFGLSGSNLAVSQSEYNLTGNRAATANSYSGESSFGGIDLRQIPTENIERIEVISGVAPVRYGDISDGAIIIERQAGKTPAFVRLQSRNNATSYGFSKGFSLSPALGDLNVDMGYVNSFADNRDKIKQYRRINGTVIWTTRFGNKKQWKHTLQGTYNKVLDGVAKDEDDTQSTIVKYGNWNFNASSRTSYQINNSFFKRFGLNLGVSTAHQQSYKEYYYNDAFVLYTDTLQTGIVEGNYDKGQYTAVDHVDGRPLNLTGRLETNAVWKIGNLTHNINFGVNADYSINNGKGRLADPSRPNKGLSLNTERYYDFSLLTPVKNLGLYLEDQFKASIFGNPLAVSAGVRWDTQNGHQSFSPRTNISYRPSKELQLGLAYGLSFKAPSLAHLYPGPVFTEYLLLNAYNGKQAESTSRIYVHRYDPPSEQLKAQYSQTLEGSAMWNKHNHSVRVNAFLKQNRNGINTISNRERLMLPVYEATPVTGSKPLVEVVGEKAYMLNKRTLQNSLSTDNYGFEVLYSSPKIEALYTSVNIAGGLTKATSKSNAKYEESFNTSGSDPKDVTLGIFNPLKNNSYLSNARVGTTTHFPKLRLIIQIMADFQLLNYSSLTDIQYYPIAYYTRDLTYYEVTKYDPQNPAHLYLYEQRVKKMKDYNSENDGIFCNFNLSMAKEINKNLRLSFNVYNFLDYQPRYYIVQNTTVKTPNSSPNYGAQITYKF